MKNTFRKKTSNRKKNKSTRKNIDQTFEREITLKFLEVLIMIKLYHWKTHSYATHKATDEFYSKFNENMDRFMEVLLGKTNSRVNLTQQKCLTLNDFNNVEQFKNKMVEFKNYLVDLDNNIFMNIMSNADLFTIRDEILADLNQLIYLLSFQ
jgi:DNA-binding ferritin-like protein